MVSAYVNSKCFAYIDFNLNVELMLSLKLIIKNHTYFTILIRTYFVYKKRTILISL